MNSLNNKEILNRIVSEIPTYATFPTFKQLTIRIHKLVSESAGAARIQKLGTSEGGRSIEMVSLGDGPHSALLVGTPHPQEVVGCLTIEFLIAYLLSHRELLNSLNYTWHFIPTIEPDGMAMNSGWLGSPLTLSNYLKNFFRPALNRQAEYTFPLRIEGYVYDHPTSGNRAWRKAIEQVRPDFLFSLHNADYGGVFYIFSESLPGLIETLTQQTMEANLTLNTQGEGFGDMRALAPGVFEMFNLHTLAEEALGASIEVSSVWPAGSSSMEYAARLCGTFSLIVETPYWDDTRLHNDLPSKFTMADIAEIFIEKTTTAINFVGPFLSQFNENNSLEAEEYKAALVECLERGRTRIEKVTAFKNHPNAFEVLSTGEYEAMKGFMKLTGLRPAAHLLRLAEMMGEQGDTARRQAETMIESGISDFQHGAQIKTIEPKTLLALQVQAGLTCAAAVEKKLGN